MSQVAVPVGLEGILTIDREVMHGKLCFKGTRVQLGVLLDNLKDGMTIDEFIDEYPTVERDQAMAIVAWQQEQTKRAAGLDLAS